MNRKFEHTDIAMIGGLIGIVGLIAFNIFTQGVGNVAF
tara:strand:- start:538 stop:651 length:114 start_codon:yes stop_codon:yes gene_type:complete